MKIVICTTLKGGKRRSLWCRTWRTLSPPVISMPCVSTGAGAVGGKLTQHKVSAKSNGAGLSGHQFVKILGIPENN
eukprot:1855817-Rhodomonas_salina.2